MASSYPSALDTFLAPATTLGGPEAHSDIEIRQNDATAAVQAELGTDPAGAFATVAARLADIETQLIGLSNPTWQDFTVNYRGIATMSASTGRYIQFGDVVYVHATGTYATTENGWSIALDLPVLRDPAIVDKEGGNGVWHLKTVGGNRYSAFLKIGSDSRAHTRRTRDNGTSSGAWKPEVNTPTTWTAGDELTFTGWYKVL